MSQNLPVNGFKWVEDLSEFDESFIKNYNEESDEGYFPGAYVWYPKSVHNFQNDLLFLPQRMKVEKIGKLVANLRDKKRMFFTCKK